MGFKTIVQPSVEPLTIDEARLHLRTDDDLTSETELDEAEDTEIMQMVSAAREHAEKLTGLYLAPRTVEQTLDRFPVCDKAIQLQAQPWRGLDSIEYTLQADGSMVPVDDAVFVIDDYVQPARVRLKFEQQWPQDARCDTNAVRVRYVVGYGTIANTPPDVLPLPADIRSAMLLIVGHLYENREETTALALESLPFGVMTLLGLNRENLGV